ncbi:MAG: hypothetical protein A2306_10480 [Omnitrophica WOR_2 bacterium RIFOXYB2_FULL_38_16]|nr:MAG: hypothetical protein A2243_04640 [Omnitrophica WOR_2 bacterium RIFOXYA2_FULL_38_17]OGX58670.1 MAG: hypothetical protein A2306_10480 [Omnitrophica WOR_2 bacterium RIFOXYB2_FULL_38_16]
MNFIEFSKIVDQQNVIDIRNVGIYFNGIDRRRLYEWQEKGHIVKIANNFYCMADADIDDDFLRSAAGKIYSPSYIGLESALSYYNFIPDAVFQTIAITTRRNRTMTTKIGDFNYRSIKNPLFFGYRLIESKQRAFFISDPEKTLLDYFYFKAGSEQRDLINEMRFNLTEISEIVNTEKLKDYLRLFASKKLDQACAQLMDAANVEF